MTFHGFSHPETLFGPNHGFPRKILVASRDFSKSHQLREAASPSLVVGLGCPDTLGVSPDSNSLISVVSDRLRPAQTIAILDTKINFGEISHSPPHHQWGGVGSLAVGPGDPPTKKNIFWSKISKIQTVEIK